MPKPSRFCVPNPCIPSPHSAPSDASSYHGKTGSGCQPSCGELTDKRRMRVFVGSTIEFSWIMSPSHLLGVLFIWRRGLNAYHLMLVCTLIAMGSDTEQSRPCIIRKYLAAYCFFQNTPSLMQAIQPVDSCINARSTVLGAYDSCTLSKQLLTFLKTSLEAAAENPKTMGVEVSISLFLPLQACLPGPKQRSRADPQGRQSLSPDKYAGMGELNSELIIYPYTDPGSLKRE